MGEERFGLFVRELTASHILTFSDREIDDNTVTIRNAQIDDEKAFAAIPHETSGTSVDAGILSLDSDLTPKIALEKAAVVSVVTEPVGGDVERSFDEEPERHFVSHLVLRCKSIKNAN